ncbi:PKD domain-containing protein [Candidatus Woesearchaeota archaeon]|nr:PKD domain-containing protein [Candidatus Woesearchaeota archaeon]
MKINKLSKIFGIYLLALMVAVTLSGALTINDLYFDPGEEASRNKNQALGCWWDVSDALNITVYWFNGTNLYRNSTYTQNSWYDYIAKSIFFRGETWNCTINASNSTTITSSSISTVIANAWPEFRNTSNVTFNEDITKAVCIDADDADNDGLTYSYNADVTFDSFDTATGCLSWTPGNADIGTHIIAFGVIDSYGSSDPTNATAGYTVVAVNDPPYFSTTDTFPPDPVYQNVTLNYTIIAHDEENETGPFNFTLNSTYFTEYGYEAFNITTNDNKTAYISFIYNDVAQRKNGTYTLTLTLCEQATHGCNTTDFNLTVLSVNYAPSFLNYTTGSWVQGGNFTFYINATDDNEGDTLTFTNVYPNNNCQSGNPWTIETLSPSVHNATGLINFTYPNVLNNRHVDCNNITITLSDGTVSETININLEINNTNDPPVIEDNSFYGNNTHPSLNYNISNLTAIFNMSFVYKINVTDPDLFIESWNETHTYDSNASACGDCPVFSISSAGIINFTITNTSYIGNSYSYSVNVTDKSGLSNTSELNLYIQNNTPPYFNESIADQTIYEDDPFFLQANATDSDTGDTIVYSDNIWFFDINSSGMISFTSDCSLVDVYNVEITVTDTYGAYSTENFVLNISFEEDAPVLINFTEEAVEGLPLVIDIFTDYTLDDDLSSGCINQSEQLTFSYEVPSQLISNYSTTDYGVHQNAYFHLTPDFGTQGEYVINITVNDSHGLSTVGKFNLTIYNESRIPFIYNITAGNSSNLSQWLDVATYFPGNITYLSITEDAGNVTFNHTTIDPDGDQLIYKWYFNGTNVSNNHAYIHGFSYNSSGYYNITLRVADNVSGFLLHNVSFAWMLNVSNVNRAPYLTKNFSNITLGGSYYVENYFTTGNSRFIDPDNDALTFSVNDTVSSLEHCTITINESNLYIIGHEVGVDYVIFSASDGSATAGSNNITINITWVAETGTQSETETQTTTSTRTITQTIIQEVEIETPVYLDIITPEPVTLYVNNTIRAPISLINKGNITLKGIRLSAETNNSLIDLFFVDDFIPQLSSGEKVTTDLIITSYKTFKNYEIYLYANITDPDYSDVAVIYVNSLEKSRGDESVTNTKITFANDLLTSNPECLELNEFLKRARVAMANGDYDEAEKIIDSVVEGCRYLISQARLQRERPTSFAIMDIVKNIPNLNIILIVIAVIILALFIFTIVSKPGKKSK